MTKRNANQAIDFARLFAVKDRLALREAEASDGRGAPTRGGEPAPPLEAEPEAAAAALPDAVEQGAAAEVVALYLAPAPVEAPSAPEPVAAAAAPDVGRGPAPTSAPGTGRAIEPAEPLGRLRVGMPRELHERVRAAAALSCLPPTTFVRDILESTTPRFDAAAPLSGLAQTARAAFPAFGAGRRTTEVRMQVPVSEELHQRLIQLAALRAQTLAACLVDALEHRVPNQ